jgi:DNA-binding PadR family transcriptional regulator
MRLARMIDKTGSHMAHGKQPYGDITPLATSTFLILLVLAAGDRHGYGIIKDVERETGGTTRLGPGTLYRLIKQLVADGWIIEVPARSSDDPRRRVYRLTPVGWDVARMEVERLDRLMQIARQRKLIPQTIG